MIQIIGIGLGATLIALAILRNTIPFYWIVSIGVIITLAVAFWPQVKSGLTYGVSAGGKIPWKTTWIKWIVGIAITTVLWWWVIPWIWTPSGKLVHCFNFTRAYPVEVWEFEPGTYQSSKEIQVSLPKDWKESRIVERFSVTTKQWGSAYRPPPSTV